LPFLHQIKLLFVCWLVIPRFNGAYYVYKSLVHPCLSVDRQSVVKWLNKPKDEVSLKPETFLAVVETYVQKNGTEALEKFMASKSKDSNSILIVEEIKSVANAEEKEVATIVQFNEPNIVQKDVKTVGPKEKNAAAAAAVKSCKEPNIAQKDVKVVEPPEQNAAAAAKRTEKKAVAAVEVEEMIEPIARKEDKFLEPPEKNAAVAGKWTEKKAVAAVEVEEMTRPTAPKEDKLPEPLEKNAAATAKWTEKKAVAAVEVEEMIEPIARKEDKFLEPPEKNAAVAGKWTEKKAVAAVEVEEMTRPTARKEDKLPEPLEKNAAATAKWTEKKEVAAVEVEEMTEPTTRKRTSFQSLQRKMQQQLQNGCLNVGNALGLPSFDTDKKAVAVVEVKKMTEPAACEEDMLPEPHAPKKVQKEWTCAVCQVTTTCEANLKSHLRGQKHRATLAELKASKQAAKNTRCSNSEQFKQRNTSTSNAGTKLSKLWCSICDIRCPEKIHMAAHLKGSKHLSRIKKMFDLCGGEQGWECGICNVRCSAESVMVGHLNGKQHLSRVEQMLNPVDGQPGFCRICHVMCSGEIDMAAHLNGGKHLSRIQEMINPGGAQ
ncbi:unnamed protein product, partial [Ilex paraguariensis]